MTRIEVAITTPAGNADYEREIPDEELRADAEPAEFHRAAADLLEVLVEDIRRMYPEPTGREAKRPFRSYGSRTSRTERA